MLSVLPSLGSDGDGGGGGWICGGCERRKEKPCSQVMCYMDRQRKQAKCFFFFKASGASESVMTYLCPSLSGTYYALRSTFRHTGRTGRTQKEDKVLNTRNYAIFQFVK